MTEETSSNYLNNYLTDNCVTSRYPEPIAFLSSNIERCQIIDYVEGWDSKGCLDPKHQEDLKKFMKVRGGNGYTRVMYRCPKHGIVHDNLYFGSREEQTGIMKCYDCISDEINRVENERYKRSELIRKEEKENGK